MYTECAMYVHCAGPCITTVPVVQGPCDPGPGPYITGPYITGLCITGTLYYRVSFV